MAMDRVQFCSAPGLFFSYFFVLLVTRSKLPLGQIAGAGLRIVQLMMSICQTLLKRSCTENFMNILYYLWKKIKFNCDDVAALMYTM